EFNKLAKINASRVIAGTYSKNKITALIKDCLNGLFVSKSV
ncbi:unnamed protein product, partial [marine sediment metagenome]